MTGYLPMNSPLAPWLASGESVSLEFKKSTAEKDRACRTLCAFANGQGGRVLFGVTLAGKPAGQTVSDRTLEELAQEFQNFEPPLFGLTPEALTRSHASKPWNPLIAQAFYRRGIIETWGRGTLKVAELMRAEGLEPPVVTVRTGAVVVTFDVAAARRARGWPDESEPVEATGKTPLETPAETQMTVKTPVETPVETQVTVKTPVEMPEKIPAAILRLLREAPAMSMAELALHLSKSKSAVERAVRKLSESGHLQHIGPKKGGHWQVLDNPDKEPR
jgi:predicted HTH transcriptional regulator